MLANGVDVKEYQYSLLSFSMVGLKPAVANNFNTNLLKKRITMMNLVKYQKSGRLHNWLIPVCLVMALLLTVSFKKEVKAESFYFKEKLKVVKPVAAPESSSKQKEDIIPINDPSENTVASPNGEEYFLGYIMKNVVYPQEALNINLEGTVQIPVKFNSSGAEVLSQEVSLGERLKEVVVVAYANTETRKHEPANPNVAEVKYLREEVSRVLKSFSSVPKDLVGKTYTISVKFIIQRDVVITGYAPESHRDKPIEHAESLDKNVKILIQKGDGSKNEKVTYVLNGEKIISAEEMAKIPPENIESVNVMKAEKIEHETLGIIEGSAVFIQLKK
jgi:hypothetical protein